jgi:hypothetical protein
MTTRDEAAQAVVDAANLVSEKRGELLSAISLRTSAREALDAALAEYRQNHALTPQELIQQTLAANQAERRARAESDPKAHAKARELSARFVRRRMQGYGPGRGSMSRTDLQSKQVRELGAPLPFSRGESLIQSMSERSLGYRPLPDSSKN